MGYIPPNTLTSGQVAQALDVQGNLRAMQDYLTTILGADLKTAAWVERKHLVRGSYEGLLNRHQFITGMVGGKMVTRGLRRPLYMSTSTADKLVSGASDLTDILAGTSSTFELDLNADVFFQFDADPICTDDGIGGNDTAWLKVYLDSGMPGETEYDCTIVKTQKENTGSENVRRSWHLFRMLPNLAAGPHNLALRGNSGSLKTVMFAWSVNLQVYYRHT